MTTFHYIGMIGEVPFWYLTLHRDYLETIYDGDHFFCMFGRWFDLTEGSIVILATPNTVHARIATYIDGSKITLQRLT